MSSGLRSCHLCLTPVSAYFPRVTVLIESWYEEKIIISDNVKLAGNKVIRKLGNANSAN